MDKKTVIITGGPGTGKTTIINRLIELGYTCLPEISRQIIHEARKKGIEQLFLENPLLFSEMLLEGRKKQHEEAASLSEKLVFIDRGIPDIVAYMHYIGDSYPSFFDEACHNHRYSQVFVLPPWKDIYISDDARYENYEQSMLIYKHLLETYQSYNYSLHEVPKGTIDERVAYILKNLS